MHQESLRIQVTAQTNGSGSSMRRVCGVRRSARRPADCSWRWRLTLLVVTLWLYGPCVAAASSKRKKQRRRELGEVGDAKVLLSVTTRNRFWPHALSMLSLLQAVRHAELEAIGNAQGRITFEWHVIDDASDQNVQKKDAMVQDLLKRGFVHNYTKLPQASGTVQVLSHMVDVVLSRPDIGYWLHSDDDVLMGPTTLTRAVRDYSRDLSGGRWQRTSNDGQRAQGGGVLAIFVNSWLDEQLSTKAPAFGPYAHVPFLGGASYVMDRATLLATGNPWAHGLRTDSNISPHDAHVLWLRHVLPEQGLPIWVRWKEPYECQHLANVQTLNFGRQPDWEPMWALDHSTKRIVEVDGYSSVDVRAALWAGGAALRDFVAAANARADEKVKLPRSASWEAGKQWSIWNYPRTHVNYVEIGTSDFDTLIQRHVWREDIVGFSLEPVRTYFERLPSHGGENKTMLNVAISDHDGYEDIFLVRPELVDGYFEADSLCSPKLVQQAGLQTCLPGWVRGTSSIKKWPEGVRQLLGDERLGSVLAMARVPCLTFGTLATVYGFGAVDVLKIDAEGFDHVVLKQVVDFAEAHGLWPWQIQFEKNSLSDWRLLDAQVARLINEFRYNCRMTGAETAACWRPERMAR